MKLKEFFFSLVKHDQHVEIYFNQEDRDGVFGFKINDVDSETLSEDNYTLYEMIESEINNAFLASNLIDQGEGDTSYILQSDFSCIKNAKYFSWVEETEQFWIESNETEYYFENIDFPFDNIMITKELDSFKIDEEKTLKKILSKQTYEEFYSFYKELLSEFQEMQIVLEVEEIDENEIICTISSMNGSYKENMNFTLLDNSKENYSKNELKSLLIRSFKIEPLLAKKITNIRLTI